FLANPTYDSLLAERLGLANGETGSALLGILERGIQQAGQIRPIGTAAFYGSQTLAERVIRHAADELTTIYAGLTAKLPAGVQRTEGIQVIILGSMAGGTHSSFVADLPALFRHVLPDVPVTITGIYYLADSLENCIEGETERTRLQANNYDSIRSLDGIAAAGYRDVVFGRNESTSFPIPNAVLLNQLYVVGKRAADGSNCPSKEHVLDRVALHVAALVSSSHLLSAARQGDDNDLCLQRVALCPDTELPRTWSTLGASGLGISPNRLLGHAAATDLLDLTQHVLGNSTDDDHIESHVDQLLTEAKLATSNSVRRLREVLSVKPETLAARLSKTAKPGGKVRNTEFATRVAGLRQACRDTHLHSVEQQMEEFVAATVPDDIAFIRRSIDRIIENKGLVFGMHVANAFIRRLDELRAGRLKTAADAESRAEQFDGQVLGAVKGLGKGLRRLLSTAEPQRQIELNVRKCLDAAVETRAQRAEAARIEQCIANTHSIADELSASIEDIEKLRDTAQEIALSCKPSHALTTDYSTAVLDLGNRDLYDAFYASNRAEMSEWLVELPDTSDVSAAQVRRELATSHTLQPLLERLVAHYQCAAQSLDVGQVIESVLVAGGEPAKRMLILIRAWIHACQPMWQARPGRGDISFSDYILIGVPGEQKSTPRLIAAINAAVTELKRNAIYDTHVQLISTNQRFRVTALRRVHGGRPHYLRCFQTLKRSFERWREIGGHSVETFAPDTYAAFPLMEPTSRVTAADEAFVIGLAMNWIARRGSRVYFNLQPH
ncbi:MAG: hypothetical protein KDB23_27160, partial [Planctomycetales bacterium]|nr:hypothetical protein [Planctomycetales bacterium]